jgi:hypothetical protein
MTALDLPTVERMLIRQFTPRGDRGWYGGVLVLDVYDVSDVGLADTRLGYDEDQVDCSNRVFQITTTMLLHPATELAWTCFPSRRWRNFRIGNSIERDPDADHPLLYLGNPIRLFKRADGLHVFGRGEFIIKSGVELGY